MLQVKNIFKQYKTGNLIQKALDGVSLNLRDSEFVAILGPSGSGKTTLLNVIGGLDHYDEGDLIINGISTRKYKDRDWDSYRNHTVGFVFQSYNLIPHQTVLANVELALTISGISKAERKKRALEALKKVGLDNQAHKKPHQMSGGQMQRVAIARALVNDPDIVLADEPTGALDSATSIQVMDLLKEVAKDRLVVMVTHNPELAVEYASRIVELKDGHICSDSNPLYVDDKVTTVAKHQNMGKSSMSLLTSLTLSFNNLKTKKARTFLTSFAGSIGIIGIALILSLSSGVNAYIKTIEEDTLSQYPLQIDSSGFDLSSMMMDMTGAQKQQSGEQVEVANMLTGMFSKIGSNDLASLKHYIEQHPEEFKDYVNAIEYSYNSVPQIYSSDLDNIHQVHPDKSLSALGLGSTTSSNSMMSSMMSTDVFYQMPSQSSIYEHQYDIKAGRWPNAYNECVVVLTSNGAVSDMMLYVLGLRDYSELQEMVQKFASEENVDIPQNDETYAYEDFLDIEFKLIDVSRLYEYDATYNVYKNKSEDMDYMKNVVENGEAIKIVGVVAPSEDASATMLKSGIAYPATLTSYVMEQAQNSEIVKQQLANPEIDIFSGKYFTDTQNNNFDMSSLFTINTDVLKSAFSIDSSKLTMNFNQLDLSNINMDSFEWPSLDVESLFKNINIDLPEEQVNQIAQEITEDFKQYAKKHQLEDQTKIKEYFLAYINQEQTQQLLKKHFNTIVENSKILEQFQNNLQTQMQDIIQTYTSSLITQLQNEISQQMYKQMGNLSQSMAQAITINPNTFAKAIEVKMTQKELSELMFSLMSQDITSYDNNLKKLNYSTSDEPKSISIYPIDFESKQQVINVLDHYNDTVNDETKVISYTDYVGALMSSVTDIINMISYVLMAFVAISLVVSSIMIGVITYISVLERKKEIGILRAIGASKRNVSSVFNAETLIIGAFAGILGIVITLILLIPINRIIHHVAGNTNISAQLPVMGAIILIVLSIVLTLLGGLLPSKKAAKEDPVTALRSE